MSLEEFMRQMRATLDAFEATWRKGMQENPEQWPVALDGFGDWHDQFLAFGQDYEPPAGEMA